jgi:Serine carboxypeptidase S28
LTQLASDFHSCHPIASDLDVYSLAANIGGIFQGIVQYNNMAPSFNVEQICEAMIARGSPYRNLVDIHEVYIYI